MVDELEETTPAQRALLEALAADNPNQLFALEAATPRGARVWFRELHPEGEAIALERRFREPELRFWSCANERAQAQAVAREVEHLLAGGAAPDAICVLVADPAREGGAVAAAMEERGIPFHLSGPTRALPAARGARRDRLAAGARRPRRLGRRGAGADPAAGRAAPRRPGAADDDRPAAQARHGRRLRGGARQPPVPARGARADPVLPEALRRRLGGDGGAPRRRLRAPPDRARSGCAASASSPPSRRSPSDCSGSRAWPSWRPPGRGASRTARPAASSPTSAPSPRPGSNRPAARSRPRPARSRGWRSRRSRGSASTTSSCSGSRPRPSGRGSAGRRAPAWCSRGSQRGERRRGAALALLRARRWPRAGRRRGGARGGAVRPGRGPARDLPDAARAGARGLLAGRARALRAAPRHRDRRQPGDRPLPRAAEAGGARPAARRRADGGGDRGGQRAAAPGRDARAAGRARRLLARLLPARLRAASAAAGCS